MATTSPRRTADVAPLTRERVLDAAIRLADRNGIASLTIRALAAELDTKPMTIYHHVDGKEAVLSGMVEVIFARIELPDPGLPWRAAVRRRCLSAREVLVDHPWAVPLLESRRTPGKATLVHHEAMLACLLAGGLSLPLTAHAYAILDSFTYGFAIQEANLAIEGNVDPAAMAAIAPQFTPDEYPTLTRFTAERVMQPDYNFGDSFEYGLDMLLGALEAAAAAERT